MHGLDGEAVSNSNEWSDFPRASRRSKSRTDVKAVAPEVHRTSVTPRIIKYSSWLTARNSSAELWPHVQNVSVPA